MTAPSAMMASNRLARASSRATTGISHDPGTFTISIFPSGHPERASASSAPASRRSVMKLLNRPTIMAKRSPFAERSPSMIVLDILFSCERGFTFFEKGACALAPVFRRGGEAECRGFEAQALVDTAIQPDIYGFHGERNGFRPVSQRLVQPGAAKRQQFSPRRNIIHQANAVGFRGIDHVSRDQHLESAPAA